MTEKRQVPASLKIVLAVGSLQFGGTETQLVKLAAGLRALGHEVSVLTLTAGGPLEDALGSMGIPTRRFAYSGIRLRTATDRRSLRVLLKEIRELVLVWRHLRRTRPHVCHAFLFTCYTHVLPLAWAASVPVRINGRRGAPPPSPAGLQRRVLDFLGHRSSSGYICNSRAGADSLARTEGVPTERIAVIANCVEIPERTAEVTRQPARGIVVANLIAYKGHADLVEALALLDDPPEMCLVGEGQERERISSLLLARGLDRVVRLAGGVPHASRLLPEYQFAVLPSHHEGMPNAVLEAMAAGLPVIATRVGGVPELLTDGVTGLLVPPQSPGELAKAIGRIAEDPELRVRLGTAARESVGQFAVRTCSERHEAAYRARLA
jgi:glycosyltransferase involved in cell wall biosynthesis